ncbi:MAG: HDOD domain-containing protein [Phycisphaerales bacterium JB054]
MPSPNVANPTHDQVEVILQSVDSLPTLTPVANRVLSIGSSDRADFGELTRLIEADPALTSKIIGLCRRAALGLGDRITTVKRALVMLGFDAVRAAVLSVSVYELLSDEARHRDGQLGETEGTPTSKRALDRVGFWMYSVGVASAAEMLAHENRRLRVKPDEAFVAGLLHGLGKPILDLLLPRAYGRVVELTEQRRTDAAAVEREVLGIDHHSAARRIAERWNLPATLRDVAWLYDHPLVSLPEGVDTEAIKIVAIARALVREVHLGESGDHGPFAPAAELCDQAGVPRSTLDKVARRLHEAVAERCKVLGLNEQAPPEILLKSITAANHRLSQLTADLDVRAKEGKRVGQVLAAIAEFWKSGGASGDVLRTLGAMTRSASRLLGEGQWVTLLDGGRSKGWMLTSFHPDGTAARSLHAESPESLAGLDLADGPSWADQSGVRSTLAEWAWDKLGLVRSERPFRVVPAGVGHGSRGCVMVTDAPAPSEAYEAKHLLPLRAGWSAALSASIHKAASERLAESLADSNRVLAATQAKLTEVQALARLGEMTAGAAHELNNPLTVIRGRAQLLADHLQDERDRHTALQIAKASGDLSDLVTAMHEIARPGRAERAATPLRGMLQDAIAQVEGAQERVELLLPVGLAENPELHVDGPRMSRALAELLRNATEWAGDGNVRLRVQIEPPDDRLVIRIEDDGPGLSSKAMRHAFDPFFSERPAGRRRGLGLPLAKCLVELHAGTVRLEPGESGGTTAVVTLHGWRAATEREAERAA